MFGMQFGLIALGHRRAGCLKTLDQVSFLSRCLGGCSFYCNVLLCQWYLFSPKKDYLGFLMAIFFVNLMVFVWKFDGAQRREGNCCGRTESGRTEYDQFQFLWCLCGS